MDERLAEKLELAYRRGVHQALTHAAQWVDAAEDLDEARLMLAMGVEAAGEYRRERPVEVRPALMDEIRAGVG